jgi:N-acetylglucosamine kinase-like BadF-type ATPase
MGQQAPLERVFQGINAAKMGHLLIGIDAGGTSTDVRLVWHAKEVGTTHGGRITQNKFEGCNLVRDGQAFSRDHMVFCLRQSLEGIAALHVTCVIGMAGAGRRDAAEQLQQSIHAAWRDLPEVPPLDVHVTHDAMIALESAYPSTPGAILIVGTGSLLFGRDTTGQEVRAGGWGRLLGDEGSGYDLGHRVITAVCADMDADEPSFLRERLAARLGWHDRDTLIDAVYQHRFPFQDVARFALEGAVTGDEPSMHLVRTAAEALGRVVARAPWDRMEPSLRLVGGLSTEKGYQPYLWDALARFIPQVRIDDTPADPLAGAVHLAWLQAASRSLAA